MVVINKAMETGLVTEVDTEADRVSGPHKAATGEARDMTKDMDTTISMADLVAEQLIITCHEIAPIASSYLAYPVTPKKKIFPPSFVELVPFWSPKVTNRFHYFFKKK